VIPARVVKAVNTLSRSAQLEAAGQHVIFISGDDVDAKAVVVHDRKLTYGHRKEARWLTMPSLRTAGSTPAGTMR
jgi:hypothetical protein